jgi:hypothetical protein
MPDDDKRDGLRIGGWVPPYRDAAGPLDAPVYRVSSAARRGGVIAGLPRAVADAPPHRRTLVLATLAILAVAVTAVLAVAGRKEPAPEAGRVVLPLPSAPVSLLPPPAASAPPTTVPSTSPPRRVPATTGPAATGPARTGRPTPTSATATRPAPTRPAAALTDGATVGLEVGGRPGDRLRHRDFRARVDRLGPGNTPLDRADSRFTVRRGMAAASCFSFESVNYPGRFLRHRDFVVHLDRRDASELFARDATFCPEPAGAAVVLRSQNYPDRTLVARDGGVHLDRAGGTAFVARPPL